MKSSTRWLIDKLDRLQDYKYYLQFTLNPYGTELESKLPPLQKRIDTFKRLSDKIGREKVVWAAGFTECWRLRL